MKTIGLLGVVIFASIGLSQSAQGGSRGGGHASGSHVAGAGAHFAGGGRAPARFSGAGSRYSGASARPYGMSPSARSFAASQSRGQQMNRARFVSNQNRASLANQSLRSGNGRSLNQSNRVLATHSGNWNRGWDRNRDHSWHGHRCHWRNGSWVVFYGGFYPYGYSYPYGGFYPYSYGGDYSYDPYFSYGEGYGYDPNYQSSGDSADGYASSDEGRGAGNFVSQVQAQLQREGYYRGAVDGVMGAGTRKALRRYQADQGLSVTGRIDGPVLKAFGLR